MHIAADGEVMKVVLHREGFVSTRMDVAYAGAAAVFDVWQGEFESSLSACLE